MEFKGTVEESTLKVWEVRLGEGEHVFPELLMS